MTIPFEIQWVFADQVTADQLVSWVASILLHFVWQGAAIAALCWLFFQSVPATASRRRYTGACLAMLMMAVAPPITGFVLQDQLRASSPVQSTAVQSSAVQSMPPTAERPSAVIGASTTADESSQPLPPTPDSWRLSFIVTVQQWYDSLLNRFAGTLVAAWLLGVTLCSLRLLSSLRAVALLRQSAVSVVDQQLLATFARLTERLKMNPRLRLMQSAKVAVPTVLGWIRPIVLFPLAFTSGLSLDQIEAVLAHELAHIQRQDYLVNLIQSVVETVLFYHPAVWWISNIIRSEREHCCDDIALSLIADPGRYAKALFELARLATTPHELSMSAAGGSLKSRIARILNGSTPARTGSGLAVAVIVGVLVIAGLTVTRLPSAIANDADQPKSVVPAGDENQNIAKDADDSPSAKRPVANQAHRVTFVITKHLLLHENRIITWDEVDPIIEAAIAKHGKVRPAFLQTTGARTTQPNQQPQMNRWDSESYGRLYKEKKIDGMVIGSISPRASNRYDRIKSAADLVPDDSTKYVGRVIDAKARPINDAEVILLPKSFDGSTSVHLRLGRLRDPHDEHLAHTDETGRFTTFPESDEQYIVAVHPDGFFISEIGSLEANPAITLQPWARIHGSVAIENDFKQSVNFTGYPRNDVLFHVWETEVGEDGQFDQPYLPPGKIVAQRGLQAGGMGLMFTAGQWVLEPGESEEFQLGPVPENQKQQAQHLARKNEQRRP